MPLKRFCCVMVFDFMDMIRTLCVIFMVTLMFSVPNAQAGEKAFSQQFSKFYPYTSARGMAPMHFVDADGRLTSPEEYKGKILILHFWATWCAPCIKELPLLNALRERMAGDARVAVVPVSLDFNKKHEWIADFMKKNGAGGLPVLTIPSEDKGWDIVTSFELPTTFIVGPDGRVMYKMIGDGDWTSPDALSFIDNLLSNQQK